MRSAWSDTEAADAIERWASAPGSNEDVALRVYTSRLIGAEPALVLHGGGNTSVKTTLPDDLGEPTQVLCVKGSGWDLGGIEPAGLPAVRLDTLARLRALPSLSDEDMVNAARTRLLDASAPNPSVETLLHAFLPQRFIDHSHADAILSLADQADAASIALDVFEGQLAVVPYVMPGFALAKLAAEVFEAHPDCRGLFLQQHGLFTFGDTAKEAYTRHIDAVSKAEAFIDGRRVQIAVPAGRADYAALAPALRGALGQVVLERRSTDAALAFAADPAVASLSQRGPATPDHVIRTKALPLLLDPAEAGDDWPGHVRARAQDFRRRYDAYFEAQVAAKGAARTKLSSDPVVALIPGVGIVAAGATRKAARVAADLYEHTIEVIRGAEAIGRYHALPEADLFDMEYWSLEQAKLGRKASPPLAGQVVLVTGAASGIGAATASAFAAGGAALFLVDRNAAVADVAASLGAEYFVADLTDTSAVDAALRACVEAFGGVDHVVSNAGTAPQAPIDDCPPEVFEGSLAINLTAHQSVAAAATRVLRAQGRGGSLLFNVSKAAFNPGRGFGPYAVAKAGLYALMKQYAIEGADAGIRSNAINADRVRTGLLAAGDVALRAKARGLDVDAYFRSNLLGRSVTAGDVANAFVFLSGAQSTTGCVITVDGGNIAASPR
ncbi:MAG: bifunctional aldolase/short-chain dehydrogenase [Nannocystaceae bacterium]|nr:bifunctional aldolase/short-chain dehydrogenase [bacterium]